MKKADIETFFSRLQAADPEPKGELDYTNPYTLLVAVVLSAQATDVGVNKATGPPSVVRPDVPAPTFSVLSSGHWKAAARSKVTVGNRENQRRW